MVSALGIAASGVRDATIRLDVAANNIANVNTAGFRPSRVESVEAPGGGVTSVVYPVGPDPLAGQRPGTDHVNELVGLMIARVAFTANVRVLDMAMESQRAVLNLLAD